MLIHTMLPKKYIVRFYNLEGEIDFEVTQVSFLSRDQLIEHTALTIEDTKKMKQISKVEVFEV